MTGGAVDLVAVSSQERYADWLKECVTSSAPAEVARVGKQVMLHRAQRVKETFTCKYSKISAVLICTYQYA